MDLTQFGPENSAGALRAGLHFSGVLLVSQLLLELSSFQITSCGSCLSLITLVCTKIKSLFKPSFVSGVLLPI